MHILQWLLLLLLIFIRTTLPRVSKLIKLEAYILCILGPRCCGYFSIMVHGRACNALALTRNLLVLSCSPSVNDGPGYLPSRHQRNVKVTLRAT